MSGFDVDWLTLREPADHEARDAGLLRAARARLEAAGGGRVVDLGSGTGSTVRALLPGLSSRPSWCLVDNDPVLLAAARTRLSDHDVETVEADLMAIETLPLGGADLVTASALFDLVSRGWLVRFAEALAAQGVGLYAALSYDGRIRFDDRHIADDAVEAAFNAHQVGDKGFGPALGPESPGALREAFEAEGFAVEDADSPWRLGPGPLRTQFLEGVAQAVAETERVESGLLQDWLANRISSPAHVVVGHRDILAMPAGRSGRGK